MFEFRRSHRWVGRSPAWIVLGLFACLGFEAIAGLTEHETESYKQWLHSLENTVKGRLKLDQEENLGLYPFGGAPNAPTLVPPYRRLAVSRALCSLEERLGTDSGAGEGGAFAALARARNHRNLCEYDQALTWYQAAVDLDTEESLAEVLSAESLATVVALDDSVGIVRKLVNILGQRDLAGKESELVLLYRYLLVHQDRENLSLLVQKVASQPVPVVQKARYWQAVALVFLEAYEAALVELRAVVKAGSLAGGLTESERAWVLTALPDLLCLVGQTGTAGALYDLLTSSQIRSLQIWGGFQRAQLDFLGSRFSRASLGFGRVCESSDAGFWQQTACEMAAQAETLSRIKAEGESHGAAVFDRP